MLLSEIANIRTSPVTETRIIYREEKEKEKKEENGTKLSAFEQIGRDVIIKITKFLQLYQVSLLNNTSKYFNFIIKTSPLNPPNTTLTVHSLKLCFEFYKPNLVGLYVYFDDATYLTLLSQYLPQLEELIIEIPISSLVNVDSSIFSKCNKLKKFSFSSGNTKLDLAPLSRCSNLTKLRISHNSDFGSLYGFDNLEKLDVRYCKRVEDILFAVRKNKKLRKIYICNTENMNTIPDLKECTALESFQLDNAAEVTDISGISSCLSLTTFSIFTSSPINYNPLLTCFNLRNLTLHVDDNLEPPPINISAFSILTNLKDLCIHNFSLSEVCSFENFSSLESLNIEHIGEEFKLILPKITVLSDDNKSSEYSSHLAFRGLKELVFNNVRLETLSDITNTYSLTSLEINDCTSLDDVVIIAGCPFLRQLRLSTEFHNNLDHSFIRHHRHLEKLYLNKDGIDDLTFLEGCTSLKELHLTCHKIHSFKGIEHCLLLEKLEISSRNDLCANSEINFLTKLRVLNISGKEVLDISELKLPNLEEVLLQQTLISSLNFLKNCPNLKRICIRDALDLYDITALSNLTKLTELTLNECSNIISLDVLGNCASLRYFEMQHYINHIGRDFVTTEKSVMPLIKCKYLTTLRLGGIPITDMELFMSNTGEYMEEIVDSDGFIYRFLYGKWKKVKLVPTSL